MKRLIVFLLLTISFFVLAGGSFAQYGEYGEPEPSLSIIVDKLVGKPVSDKGGSTDADYVDNLSPSDPRFAPGQKVFFKIKVKNTSDEKLKDVTVRDFLPDFVELVEAPGEFNSDERSITISAGDLEVDEEKVYFLTMRVLPQEQLPEDSGLFCPVNTVETFNGGVSDEDTAQFCVEKEVLGVSEVPSAGPELGVILLSGQLTALGLGFLLKRKASTSK